MDKKLTFSGGEPDINWDDLNRDEIANREALFAIMAAFEIGTNENFIISGCIPSLDTGVDVDVTAGYIFLNGEILEVEAQTVVDGGTSDLYKYSKVTTYDVNGDKTFNDGTPRETWQKNRGVVVAATSPILTTELDVIDGDKLTDKIVQFVTGIKTTKVIANIGDWNMDTTAVATIDLAALSIDPAKVRSVTATIRNNADTIYSDFVSDHKGTPPTTNANISWSTSTNLIALERNASGVYDNTNYNSTSYNRGFVVIEYID